MLLELNVVLILLVSMIFYVFAAISTFQISTVVDGLLYPQESETRELKEIGGLWSFVREEQNTIGYGFVKEWYKADLELFTNSTRFPVPSAYNDLTQDAAIRDHVGWVWYQKKIFVPNRWKGTDNRVMLRFGSVNYYAAVYLNNEFLVSHAGGHLPFEIEVTSVLDFEKENCLTVAVNNTLSHHTIPPGEFQYINDRNRYAKGFFKQVLDFDFFNYAGILRPVVLYTVPETYIDDVSILADMTGRLIYALQVKGQKNADTISVMVRVIEKDAGTIVNETTSRKKSGQIQINNPKLWWPRGLGKNRSVAYLYQLEISLLVSNSVFDVYRLDIGFRTIKVTKTSILINNEPFYCHGFGMHEDSELRGRGFDWVTMIKDFNMIDWLNGNCFRTSHYPYSEERYIEADKRGIAIISEVPAVGVRYFTSENLRLHEQMLREMILRDKNHPSVIMWSLANEPQNDKKEARKYFKSLIKIAHETDSSRPVTIVNSVHHNTDQTGDLVDVICVNRYYGWYWDTGYLSTIGKNLMYELSQWYKTYQKPLIVTEYGAGSLLETNYDPPMSFSESYQVHVMLEYFKVFDQLRERFLTGEMIWNFADFMTSQSVKRVAGNRKGILTRNRQPKMAAYELRRRYHNLDRCFLPSIWSQNAFCSDDSNRNFDFL